MISGDNSSFRIHKRKKTQALLRLTNVVSPFHPTRGTPLNIQELTRVVRNNKVARSSWQDGNQPVFLSFFFVLNRFWTGSDPVLDGLWETRVLRFV